jgi:hypothetical protein
MGASGRLALQHGLGVKDDKGVANDKAQRNSANRHSNAPRPAMSTRSGARLFFQGYRGVVPIFAYWCEHRLLAARDHQRRGLILFPQVLSLLEGFYG